MKLESTMVTNRMDATNVFGAEVRPGQPVEAQKCPVRPSRRPSRRPSSGVRRRPSSVVRRVVVASGLVVVCSGPVGLLLSE